MATDKSMKNMSGAHKALASKAKAAGQSVYEYAKAHKGDKGTTGDTSRAYVAAVRRSGPQSRRQSKAAA